MKYKIVESITKLGLEEEINYFIETERFEPLGGVTYVNGMWCQAIIKK